MGNYSDVNLAETSFPSKDQKTKHQNEKEPSEEIWQLTLENLTDTVLLTDKEGNFEFICPNVEHIFGLKTHQISHLENVESLIDIQPNQVFNGNSSDQIEHIQKEIILPNGNKRKLLINIRKINSDAGYFLFSCRDITELSNLKQEKKKLEKQIDEIVNHLPGVLWMTDLDHTELLYLSSQTESIYGHSDELIKEKFPSLEDIIHPDDLEKHYHLFENMQKYPEKGPFEIDFRIIKNDKVHWIHSMKTPVKNKNGEYSRVIGFDFDITEKKRMEEKIKRESQEKDILLHEVHHRVKNNLQIIISLIRLQLREMKSPNQETKETFKDIENRIYGMALIHKLLYQQDFKQRIDIDRYLTELSEHVIENYLEDTNEITLSTDIESSQLNMETLIPCGIVVTELITNSIQHGFENEDKGRISIDLQKQESNTFKMIISDNGVGGVNAEKLEVKSGLGLRLVRNLIRKQLKGEINLKESEAGTMYEIIFKEKQIRNNKEN